MAVILQAPSGLLELPNPQEDDIEALDAEIQVHTSVSNITRVYRRRGGYRKFSMTFILTIGEAATTKVFLQNCMSEWLLLTDYRGRQHRAIITSDPVEFTAVKRHRESVTLDFLGVQL